ncbi:uncharacterized protein LOC6498102 [Drosophila ananassae]|uniref:uncharacterized protein LOC6498102 n=1 Tax=Drosophila ananassae TaxID=7217 RepID=UPI0013A5ED63|nr:uncharacterized protein LOC6498102 [Drosophila ananassae]
MPKNKRKSTVTTCKPPEEECTEKQPLQIIKIQDTNYLACDLRNRDPAKCQSCLENLGKQTLKIYANNRNYLACEVKRSLPINLNKTQAQPQPLTAKNRDYLWRWKLKNCPSHMFPKCPQVLKPPKTKEKKQDLNCKIKDFYEILPQEPLKRAAIRSEVLKESNKYRKMHCACIMKLDNAVTKHAQEWAEYLAAHNLLETRPLPKYGENIMRARKDLFCVKKLLKLWYQEKYHYDYLKPGFGLYTGHFTQMVWQRTQYLGVGVASDKTHVWLVCNYHPAGNTRRFFKSNVLPRKLFLSESDMESNNPEDEEYKAPCKQEHRQPCLNTRYYL